MRLYTPSLKNKGQGNYESLPSHCFHFLLPELSDEGLCWNNVEGVRPEVPGRMEFSEFLGIPPLLPTVHPGSEGGGGDDKIASYLND